LYEIYLQDPCVYKGFFGVGLLNDVSQILPRPTLVAMNEISATIGYNLAYMRHISEILASNRGFWG